MMSNFARAGHDSSNSGIMPIYRYSISYYWICIYLFITGLISNSIFCFTFPLVVLFVASIFGDTVLRGIPLLVY